MSDDTSRTFKKDAAVTVYVRHRGARRAAPASPDERRFGPFGRVEEEGQPVGAFDIRLYDVSTLMYGGVTDSPRQLDPTKSLPPVGRQNTPFVPEDQAVDSVCVEGHPGDLGLDQYLQFTAQGFYYNGVLDGNVFQASNWPNSPLYDRFYGDQWIGSAASAFLSGNSVIGYTDEGYTQWLMFLENLARGAQPDSVSSFDIGSLEDVDQLLINLASESTNGIAGLPPYRDDSGAPTLWDTVQLVGQGTAYRRIPGRWQLPLTVIGAFKLAVKLRSDGRRRALDDGSPGWKPSPPADLLVSREVADPLIAAEVLGRAGTQTRIGTIGEGGPPTPDGDARQMAMVQRSPNDGFASEYWTPGRLIGRGDSSKGLAVLSDDIFFEEFDTGDSDNFYVTSDPSRAASEVTLNLRGKTVGVMLVPRWWRYDLSFEWGYLTVTGSSLSFNSSGPKTITGWKRALTRPLFPQPFICAFGREFTGGGSFPDNCPVTGDPHDFAQSPGRRQLFNSPQACLRAYHFLPDGRFSDVRSKDALFAWAETSTAYKEWRDTDNPTIMSGAGQLSAHLGQHALLTVRTEPPPAGSLAAALKAGERTYYVWRRTDSSRATMNVVTNVGFNSVGDFTKFVFTGSVGEYVMSCAILASGWDGAAGFPAARSGDDLGGT